MSGIGIIGCCDQGVKVVLWCLSGVEVLGGVCGGFVWCNLVFCLMVKINLTPTKI